MESIDLCGIEINRSIDSEKISNFDCGNDGLNSYLKESAKSDSKLGINKTTLFFNRENELVGYYSLQSAYFQVKEHFDAKLLKEYPTDDFTHREVNFPSIQINNFAVDKRFQRKGIGSKMMFKLFYSIYISVISSNLGVSLITLDSLPDVEDFYRHFGFDYSHKNFNDVNIASISNQFSMLLRFSFVCDYLTSMSSEYKPDADFLSNYN